MTPSVKLSLFDLSLYDSHETKPFFFIYVDIYLQKEEKGHRMTYQRKKYSFALQKKQSNGRFIFGNM